MDGRDTAAPYSENIEWCFSWAGTGLHPCRLCSRPTCPLALAESPYLHWDNDPTPEAELQGHWAFVGTIALCARSSGQAGSMSQGLMEMWPALSQIPMPSDEDVAAWRSVEWGPGWVLTDGMPRVVFRSIEQLQPLSQTLPTLLPRHSSGNNDTGHRSATLRQAELGGLGPKHLWKEGWGTMLLVTLCYT